MCKNLILPIVIILLTSLCSCNSKIKEPTLQKEFVVTVSINNYNNRMVYLHKFVSDKPQIIDSSKIANNQVEFKGTTLHPERYVITIESLFGSKLFAVANDSIQIEVSKKDLENALVTGSELNTELNNYQNNLKKIYHKIDVLFPELQRARLENNPEKLLDISAKINIIEKEGVEFNFQYTQENSKSFLAAMILNDLSKNDNIDIHRIRSTYENFSNEIKGSVDSKELQEFLNSL